LMDSRKKWTIVGAVSALGLGAVGFGSIAAANALDLQYAPGNLGEPGISVNDVREPSGIPSAPAPSATSAPTPDSAVTPPNAESPASPASPADNDSADSPASSPSPVSPASPLSADSPASP